MDVRLPVFFALTFGISWGIPGLMLFIAPWVGGAASVAMYSLLYYLAVWGPA